MQFFTYKGGGLNFKIGIDQDLFGVSFFNKNFIKQPQQTLK